MKVGHVRRTATNYFESGWLGRIANSGISTLCTYPIKLTVLNYTERERRQVVFLFHRSVFVTCFVRKSCVWVLVFVVLSVVVMKIRRPGNMETHRACLLVVVVMM